MPTASSDGMPTCSVCSDTRLTNSIDPTAGLLQNYQWIWVSAESQKAEHFYPTHSQETCTTFLHQIFMSVHANSFNSFTDLYRVELCSFWCKKFVREKMHKKAWQMSDVQAFVQVILYKLLDWVLGVLYLNYFCYFFIQLASCVGALLSLVQNSQCSFYNFYRNSTSNYYCKANPNHYLAATVSADDGCDRW